jgi:hypothetical protein
MTMGVHDHRTYGHCGSYGNKTLIDFSVAVAAPFPEAVFRNGFAEMTILEAVFQVTETLDTADALATIGKPGTATYFASFMIPNLTAAGVIVPITLIKRDIPLGVIVEITYTSRAGAGAGRVLMGIGEALHER